LRLDQFEQHLADSFVASAIVCFHADASTYCTLWWVGILIAVLVNIAGTELRRCMMTEAKSEQGTELELVLPHAVTIESGDPLLRAHMFPCRLVLETPVINFTVRTLMRLEAGSVVETAAQHNEDLLLHVNGQLVGTVKFDVTRDRLAVRLTGVA
jgi:flagellar motor switch/type III secretory pathway protein FliN